MFSPILTWVELICVVVPWTTKSPFTVKFEPFTEIAFFNDDVYWFNCEIDISTDADFCSKLFNLPSCEGNVPTNEPLNTDAVTLPKH